MDQIVNLIQTVGFPIAMVGACSYFIYLLWKQSKEREDKYIQVIGNLLERFDAQDLQLQAIVMTQEKIIERLEKFEKKGEG
jgi:hypothetical protein